MKINSLNYSELVLETGDFFFLMSIMVNISKALSYILQSAILVLQYLTARVIIRKENKQVL